MKEVAYGRVSTKDQNLQRQLDAFYKIGIDEKHIYVDKKSGENLERVGYKYMKQALEEGDTLVITSLDRLGRNQNDIKDEWEYFRRNKINVRVLDMPALNIEYKDDKTMSSIYTMISNIVFELMSWQAEEERKKIKQRQREGIDSAKAQGKHLGRPNINYESLSDEQKEIIKEEYQLWVDKKIKGVTFREKLGLKTNTFYKIMKEYENIIKVEK